MVKEYKGIRPYEHQKAVINELREARGTGKIITVNSSRQKGKSYLVSNLLLYFGINYHHTNNFCLTPTLKQAKNIYKLIIDAISKTDLIRHRNTTELTIELINGSTINFKSAEQREGLRGFTADFLVVDEAAFIPDEIFYLVLPWVDAKKAPMLLTSTPFLKSGFFYKYFCLGKEGKNNVTTVDWTEERFKDSIQQILSPEKLEEYRKILPKNVFRTEYLGEFLDGDGTVFSNIRQNTKFTLLRSEDKLFVGIDWASGKEGDYTVVSAFNQNKEQVLLKYWNNKNTVTQINLLVDELEPIANQIQVITSESNSLGTPLTDLLKDRSQILSNKVKEFTTTNSSKNDLVVKMQVALEQNEVKLLPDEKEIAEFGYYTAEYNQKTRKVTYNAPSGLHDDTVMATLMAFNGITESVRTGNYTIGFYNRNRGRKQRYNHN